MSESVIKPWGGYIIIDRGHGFLVKRLHLNPHCNISLQRHMHRSETWIVVSGEGEAYVAEEPPMWPPILLGSGSVIGVPERHWHTLYAFQHPLVLIELWRGEDLREDDIERKPWERAV